MQVGQPRLRVPSTLRQTAILSAKNLKLFVRKPSIIISHVFMVFFVMLWLKYMNTLIASDSAALKTKTFAPKAWPKFQHCPVGTANCLTLGVIVFSDLESDPLTPWVQSALTTVRETLALEPPAIQTLYQGNNLTEIGNSFLKFGEIKSVLFFCNRHTFIRNESVSFSCEGVDLAGSHSLDLNIYGVVYNQSAIAANLLRDPNQPQSFDPNSLILKRLIDQSIIAGNREAAGDASPFEFDLEVGSYPKPKLEPFRKFDAHTVWASYHYIFLILISFAQFVKLTSQEKTLNLRKGLEPYGLSALAYWLSWLVFALVLNLGYTLVIAVVTTYFGAITFTEVPLLLSGFLLFSTMTAYSFLGILVTTACPDYRSASKVSYLVFIVSLFLQIFFSQNILASMFFWEKRPLSMKVVQWVLSLLPSFPFTIVCNAMHFEAGFHFDILTVNYVKGPGYNLTTYLTPYSHDFPFLGGMRRPADVWFQGLILALTLLYALVILVLDHKVESNRGHKAKFFSRFRSCPAPCLNPSDTEESILENDPLSIFEVRNLTKVFRHPFVSSKSITALDNVSLVLRRNETMALLGENGAGKSTLISILTGVIDRTAGQLFFEGEPFNPHRHQKLLISVCPQYDLLWAELSVFENLFILGQFKGLEPGQIRREVKEILAALNLKDQKKTLVRNLSGGMRRRASVGMALLGPSELVILDEPTTGLDPINRKAVWSFIELLKRKGKTVLLTTHIMDEADFLSDRIAIINRGRILTVARSIDLKNQFNKVNVIFSLKAFSHDFAQDLRAYFVRHFPGAHSLKYLSEKRIKFNVTSSLDNLKRLTADFEGDPARPADSRLFDEYIDSFEIAVLDLEEAYILVNEESERSPPQSPPSVAP